MHRSGYRERMKGRRAYTFPTGVYCSGTVVVKQLYITNLTKRWIFAVLENRFYKLHFTFIHSHHPETAKMKILWQYGITNNICIPQVWTRSYRPILRLLPNLWLKLIIIRTFYSICHSILFQHDIQHRDGSKNSKKTHIHNYTD